MRIANLNERITIQKNTAVVDSVGNHLNLWRDYFTCAAYTAGTGYKQSESEKAGVVIANDALAFTVRYCSELANLDPTQYRILFRHNVYNITAVDMMNYGKRSIKISCEREMRLRCQDPK